MPGDPAVAYAGPHACRAQLAQVREPVRAGQADGRAARRLREGACDRGLGHGAAHQAAGARRPGAGDPATLELVGAALLLALLVGIPLGIAAARRRGRRRTSASGSSRSDGLDAGLLARAILQYLFFQRLGWFPVAGRVRPALDVTHPLDRVHAPHGDRRADHRQHGDPRARLSHLVLPTIAVAAYPTGVIAQMTRASLIEQLGEDHVRMARGAGLRGADDRPPAGAAAGAEPGGLRDRADVRLRAGQHVPGRVDLQLAGARLATPRRRSRRSTRRRSSASRCSSAVVYVLATLLVDLAQAWLDPRVQLRCTVRRCPDRRCRPRLAVRAGARAAGSALRARPPGGARRR